MYFSPMEILGNCIMRKLCFSSDKYLYNIFAFQTYRYGNHVMIRRCSIYMAENRYFYKTAQSIPRFKFRKILSTGWSPRCARGSARTHEDRISYVLAIPYCVHSFLKRIAKTSPVVSYGCRSPARCLGTPTR